jgi:cytochrome b
MQQSEISRDQPPLKVWDPLIRIFHWSLAGFFLLAYFLEGDWMSLHSHAGYTVALLILFRLLWGIIGSRHARFADFVASSTAVFSYLVQLARRNATRHVGHDPAGAAMILVLLTGASTTAFTGMSLFAMEGSGPLAGTFVSSWPGGLVTEVHELAANFTLAMVAVHVLGVLLTSLSHRENLIRSMLTGKKARSDTLANRTTAGRQGSRR